MTIESSFSASSNTLRIRVKGNFTCDVHPDFTRAYKSLPPSSMRKYVIDFSKTDYIDSAALGMLLVLRERAGGDNARIVLSGARADVKRILDISGFEVFYKNNRLTR